MKWLSAVAFAVVGWLFVTIPLGHAAESPPEVDYAGQIKPLLAAHCGACHGVQKQQSGLRTDTAAALLAGGNSGPAIVPHKPQESLLLQALTGAEGVTQMPPEGKRLTAGQVELLRQWIARGAPAPADEIAEASETKHRDHWSFQPVVRPEPPAVRQADRVRNPIDAFILARLEKEGVVPAPEADRVTLIRRLSLDLRGLPPSPAEVDEFLTDSREGAYERLVDRMLASPHYGERWGRQWLDQARYADSNGFTRDMARTIWSYRDWVINALNRDLPFDQFTIEQIAGDLLPEPTLDQLVATGFHRNTLINEEGGTDPEQFRVEAVIDRVNTTGAVFLGLTVACAQCHDHKFDPISQREYYQLYAFFNNTVFEPRDPYAPIIDVPTPEQIAAGEPEKKERILREIAGKEAKLAGLTAEISAAREAWVKSLTEEQKQKLPFNILNAVNLPEKDRSAQHTRDLEAYFRGLEETRKQFPPLEEIAALKAAEPKFVTTMVTFEAKESRETFVQIRGDFLRPGARVSPGVPAVLPPLQSAGATPTRLDLARWLVDPRNPLTPRVMMNRLWQKYFGQGLVETENDFGTQGSSPTHPELLDWLAAEFVDRGWSLKAMHKTIVMSATYRQSSHHRPELDEIDPNNKLLARQSRIRLDAELIRDSALAASGLLNPEIGGPSVYPPQPEGVFDFTQDRKPWKTETGGDRYRRGMYTYLWRSSPYPAMTVFDFPDANITCTRRNRSNTPLQSLTLANDLTFVEFAQGLAMRVLQEVDGSDSDRLTRAFRLCLAREPSSVELARLAALLDQQRQSYTGAIEDARKLVPNDLPATLAAPETAAWIATCRVLLNLDEFITRE